MPHSNSLALAALVLVLILGSATHADEPPPTGTSSETVLSNKGLTRKGQSYILADTDARDRRLSEFAEMKRGLDAQYKPLFDEVRNREIAVENAKSDVRTKESSLEDAKREVTNAKDE